MSSPLQTPPRTVGDFYARVETAKLELDERLTIFADEYRRHRASLGRPVRVLDVGCGRRALLAKQLEPGDTYCGCDIVEPDAMEIDDFVSIDLTTESLAEKLAGRTFDVVYCGELIEHVFSPDAVLEDIRSVLSPDGVLILSTPNLAYWVNRLLLLAGISPMFVENSSRKKLGRRLRALGQGNKTEGHIRLFTYGAVLDLLDLHGFRFERARATQVWPFVLDRWVARFAPRLAPDVVYIATPGAAPDGTA